MNTSKTGFLRFCVITGKDLASVYFDILNRKK